MDECVVESSLDVADTEVVALVNALSMRGSVVDDLLLLDSFFALLCLCSFRLQNDYYRSNQVRHLANVARRLKQRGGKCAPLNALSQAPTIVDVN